MPGINLSENLDEIICGNDAPLSLNSADKSRIDLEVDSEVLEYTDANLKQDLRRLREYTFAQTSNNYPFLN